MTNIDNALPSPLLVRAHGATHAGRVRQSNEDALHCDPSLGIYVVADGMGGHTAGEVASGMAVETIRDFLERSSVDDGLTWPFGLATDLSHDGNRVATAVRLANRKVFGASEAKSEYAGMGTTVVAMVVDGALATFCSIGDSRLYSLRSGRLEQLTSDDTWITAVLAQDAQADLSELQHHPLRHVLTDAVGMGQDAKLVVQERRLERGEVLLMCSDGLHTELSDSDIASLLSANSADPEAACAALVGAALDAGARDNVTALVLRAS